jgi:hypothetical protein
MQSKLLLAAQALAICGVIAFMAWTKSRGITGVIPYFPHRRNETSLTVRRTGRCGAAWTLELGTAVL